MSTVEHTDRQPRPNVRDGRAVAIIRVSQQGGREGDAFMSPEQQRDRIKEACRREGLSIRDADIFDETDSVSGGLDLAKRKGLSLAVKKIESGEASVLVGAYFSRLFRSLRTQAEVIDTVEGAGGRVLAVDVGDVSNKTASKWLQGTILGAMTEYYRREAAERSRDNADSLVARGVQAVVPFGYRRNGTFDGNRLVSKIEGALDGKALVPDLVNAPFVIRLFEMRAALVSWREIAQYLTDAGAKPPRGGHWAQSTLKNMIANETYLGVLIYGDRRIEGTHAPLVTRQLWRAAQSTITVKRTGKNVAGLAGGLLVCAHCGGRLSVTGTDNPSYTCRRIGSGCDAPVYISRKHADAYVEREIRELLADANARVSTVATSRELAALRQNYNDARADLENYVSVASALDVDVFRIGLDQRQARVDAARNKLESATDVAEISAALPTASVWESLDLDHKRQAARAMIDRVEVLSATEGARITAEALGVERVASRGRTAGVENRFVMHWAGD
jgi:DNA invertase Pin-like site-specific DNA recombinase